MWLSQPTQHTPSASATTSLSHEWTMCAMWQMWREGRRGKWTEYPGFPRWIDSSQTQPTEWTVWLTAVMEWKPVWRPTPQSPHVSYMISVKVDYDTHIQCWSEAAMHFAIMQVDSAECHIRGSTVQRPNRNKVRFFKISLGMHHQTTTTFNAISSSTSCKASPPAVRPGPAAMQHKPH